MKRLKRDDCEDFSSQQKKIKPSSLVFQLPNEMIATILSFLDWKLVITKMSLISRQFYSEACSVPLHVEIKDSDQFKFLEFGDHRPYSSIDSMKISMMKGKLTHTFGYFIRNSSVNNLTKLEIISCFWTDENCEIFKNSSFLKLRELNLSHNCVSDDGVYHICESTALSNLRLLNLESNRISDYNSNKSITITQLTKLKIRNNFIKNYSKLLRKLPNLTCLRADGNQFMDIETLRSTIDSSKNLLTLNLSYTTLSAEVFKYIIENKNCKTITKLNICSTVRNESCLPLENSLYLTNITNLSLNSNKISDKTCQILSSSNNLKSLTRLSLYNNLIENSGLESIMTNLEKLISLNLGGNRINDDGIKYLINNGIGKLEFLTLFSDYYSVEIAKEFYNKLKVDKNKIFLSGKSFESDEETDLNDVEGVQTSKKEEQPSEEQLLEKEEQPCENESNYNQNNTVPSSLSIDLPKEIMFHIFTYLGWKPIITSISKTSNFWADETKRIPLNVEITSHDDILIPPTNFNGSLYNIQSLNMRNIFVRSHAEFSSLKWISKNIFNNMKRLVLSSCHLDGLMCEMLCNNISENSIVELDLSKNTISDYGASMFFKLMSTKFNLLENLNLSSNRIRDISGFTNSNFKLKSLNLANNKLRSVHFKHDTIFTQLEKLKLNGNDNISSYLFATIQKIKSITHLNLNNVKSFEKEMCISYFRSANHPNLTTLKISSNIGDEGCLELAKCLLPNLTTLKLDVCSLSNVGCKYIANSSAFGKLKCLSLYGNRSITDDGLISLIESTELMNKNLKLLNLGLTNIGDGGMDYLLENGIKTLERIDIPDINCSKRSIKNIKSKFKETISISKHFSASEDDMSEEEEEQEEEIEDDSEMSDY